MKTTRYKPAKVVQHVRQHLEKESKMNKRLHQSRQERSTEIGHSQHNGMHVGRFAYPAMVLSSPVGTCSRSELMTVMLPVASSCHDDDAMMTVREDVSPFDPKSFEFRTNLKRSLLFLTYIHYVERSNNQARFSARRKLLLSWYAKAQEDEVNLYRALPTNVSTENGVLVS